jgi:hypothetical protein
MPTPETPTLTLTIPARALRQYVAAFGRFAQARDASAKAEKAHNESVLPGTGGSPENPLRYALAYPKKEGDERNRSFAALQSAERALLSAVRLAASRAGEG